MIVRTFKRGIKLHPCKEATEGHPVECAPLPKRVVIPINQHFGAPNKSIVKVGDTVKRGQKIAEALKPGLMTVPVHASITGTVKKIEPHIQANNTEGLCILIEANPNADKDRDVDFMPPLDAFDCTKTDALKRIQEAGIVGLGGAGFPSHVKLSPPPDKKIDLLIANGAECEPYLTTDEAIISEKPHLLITGIAIVMHITGVRQAIIGIEDNKKTLIPLLEREIRLRQYPDSITVEVCKTLYPQGGEKMLIKALTGREVPSGGLPMDTGCIVQNVGSLVSIAEAFTVGKPLIDRDLTVSGGACKTPKNIRTPIGTILTDLPVEFMTIEHTTVQKILFGGPMMGTAVPSLEIPIQKNTSGIILMTGEETNSDSEASCIRCGRCINFCACRLAPALMKENLDAGDLKGAVKAGLLDCIECGSCTYVCPARIKLVQRFRVGKQIIRMRQQGTKK